MYVIESGSVNCLKMVDGAEALIKTCGVGDFFNECALLHDCRCTHSAEAKEKTRLWLLDREVFASIVMDYTRREREVSMKFLTCVPLLENFDVEALGQLADLLNREDIAPGTSVYQQGDEADKFYFVESGRL